jgi:hypothetical protein
MNNSSQIIVTGIDNSGKSTLCLELAKRLYYPIINRMKPKETIFRECMDFLTSSDQTYIVDRFHIDERVYGPIVRNKIRFDTREYDLIELSMLSLATFNIYCTDSLENIERRCKQNHETFIVGDQIRQTLEKFEEEIGQSALTWHRYTIGDSIDGLAEKIKKHFAEKDIETRKEFFQKWRTAGDYFNAKYLFIGEKYGGDVPKEPLIPFGSNEPGEFLFKAIHLAGIDLKDVLITNAFKNNEILPIENEKQVLADEMQLPKLEKIICLGTSAYDEALPILLDYMFKPDIIKIYHPSYCSSYANISVETYAKSIRKAIYGKEL